MNIEYKSVGVAGVKSLSDQGDGIVEAIVSVTGVQDNVSDIIEPGAYTKTLQKRTPKGVWHHSWEKTVSKTLGIKELMPGDPELPATLPNGEAWPSGAGALKVKMQFNMGTQRGREAHSDVLFYDDQQEWSIGYHVPTGASTTQNGVRSIKSLELFEYSPVLFGAMGAARTTSVKEAQTTLVQFKELFGENPDAWLLDIKSAAMADSRLHESDDDDDTDDPFTQEEKEIEDPADYGLPSTEVSAVNIDLIRKVQDATKELLAALLPDSKAAPAPAAVAPTSAPSAPSSSGGKLPMKVKAPADQAEDINQEDNEEEDGPTSIVQELDKQVSVLGEDLANQLAPMAQNFDHAVIGDDPEALELAADNLLSTIDNAIDSADPKAHDALKAIALAVGNAVDDTADQDEQVQPANSEESASAEGEKAWSPGIVYQVDDLIEGKSNVRTEAGVSRYGRQVGHPTHGINYGVLNLTPQQTLEVSTLHPNSSHIYASLRHGGSTHGAALRVARNVDRKRTLVRTGKTDTIKKSSGDYVARMEAMHKVPESKAWEETVAVKDYDIDYQIKRQFTTEQREKIGSAGHALKNSDGTYSFPIETREDVSNAVQSIGRANDPEKAKAFIIKEARRLNCMDEIPSDWMDGKDFSSDVNETKESGEKLVLSVKELADLGVTLDL